MTTKQNYDSPIEWFDIVIQNIERATQFYEAAFDVTLKRVDDPDMKMAIFPYQDDLPGGALVESPLYEAHKAGAGTTIIYLRTDSISKRLNKIEKLGGKTVLPVKQIGENGYIAIFKDIDDNCIGLWSKNA